MPMAVDEFGNVQTDESPQITVHIENSEKLQEEGAHISVEPAEIESPAVGEELMVSINYNGRCKCRSLPNGRKL